MVRTKITNREILVAGCSHVYGHGMSDCLTYDWRAAPAPSKFAWPHLLGEWSGFNIVNMSRPGNSLGNIVYDILNYEYFNRLSGIIVVLPLRDRFLIKGTKYKVDAFLPTDIYYDNKLEAIVKYLEHLQSDEIEKINYIGYISYIVLMAKQFNIPCWISAGSESDQALLTNNKNIPFVLNTKKSWYNYYAELGYPLTPDSHLDKPAHRDFFENFIKPWVEENILAKSPLSGAI